MTGSKTHSKKCMHTKKYIILFLPFSTIQMAEGIFIQPPEACFHVLRVEQYA